MGVNKDPIVTLAIEPEHVMLPLLNDSSTALLLKLVIYNASDIKRIYLKLDYDSTIMYQEACSIDPDFYSSTGGWRGLCGRDYLNAEFPRSFSGSSVAFLFFFIVYSTGSTEVKPVLVKLLDSNGNEVRFRVKVASVKIVSFEEYANSKYGGLIEGFKKLSIMYRELRDRYDKLLVNYSKALDELNSLTKRFKALNDSFKELKLKCEDSVSKYQECIKELKLCKLNYEKLEEICTSLNTILKLPLRLKIS